METAIEDKASDEKTHLSRLIATYDWKYTSMKRPADHLRKYWEVLIGNSIGTFVDEKPIVDIRKIVIAYEYTFKHYSVTSGLLQVKIDNKLYDSRVFVK